MDESYKFSIQNDKCNIECAVRPVWHGKYEPVNADKVLFLDDLVCSELNSHPYTELVLKISVSDGVKFTYAFLGCGFGAQAVLNGTLLAVLIGNLFSIVDLFEGSVIVSKNLDASNTCFALGLLKDGYIAVTETDVIKLDFSGNVVWSAGGADIFFNWQAENPTAYILTDEYIELYDFNGMLYRFDLKDGRVLLAR